MILEPVETSQFLLMTQCDVSITSRLVKSI